MSHIHTQPGQHDLTASAFIVNVSDENDPKILLHVHKKLGKLLQPGGHVELNENPWQAITHEVREETGYEMHELKVLQSAPNIEQDPGSNAAFLPNPILINSHKFSDTDHFHDDLVFAFLASDTPVNKPDEGESQELVWVNLAELKALPDDKIIKNAREIAQFVLENFKDWRVENIDNFKKEVL